MNADWVKKQYLLAWIFDVGHGICAFVRTPSRDAVLVDCGGTPDVIDALDRHLLPSCREHVTNSGRTRLAQVVISHPHVDHFLQIQRALELHPYFWTCPHDKEPLPGYTDERLDWELVSNPEGSKELEHVYRDAYAQGRRRLPLQAFVPTSEIPHFSYGLFYIPPPECKPLSSGVTSEHASLPKRDYANNTSIMAYFRFSKSSILMPGDMMDSGMARALTVGCESRIVGDEFQDRFAAQSSAPETLRKWVNCGCSILVAPHHGLESAYSPEFFRSLPATDSRVKLVIISEKAEPGPSDGKTHPNYQKRDAGKVNGIPVRNEKGEVVEKLSLTTREDGHCLVGFRGADEIGVVVSHDLTWIMTEGPECVFA